MFLATASVKRPIAMTSLIIGLTILGIFSYFKMGLELLPAMDVPYITILTVYPGASPEQIETDIAKRIEDKMVTISSLKHVSSTCLENMCQTLLEFQIGTDVDIAATDVREKLGLIVNDLPIDAEEPQVLKLDINSTPIVKLALTGNATVDELYDYANNTLKDKITVITGVADVELIGGNKREVQVLLDRDKLAAKNLTSYDIVKRISSAIKTIPSGYIKQNGRELTVEFNAEFNDYKKIADLEIVSVNGKTIYLRDIATVEMHPEELKQGAFNNTTPGVVIKVVKRSDANAVKVVSAVRQAMSKLNEELPGGMKLVWYSDDGEFIEATANNAWSNILQGILLTGAILFLFFYDLKILAIVGISMPLNMIFGFSLMSYLDYSFNMSTLLSIGLSVGILVTNSLVVLESIMKKLEETNDPERAAIEGTSECTVPVLASCGTNIVVLFPIALTGGKIGQFLAPLAWTMVIVTAASLLLSFTLIPMLASIFIKPKDKANKSILHKMEDGFNNLLEKVTSFYGSILELGRKNIFASLVFLVIVLLSLFQALSLASTIGGDFFPQIDKGELSVKFEFPNDYSLEKTVARTLEAQKLVQDIPHLKDILITVGKTEGGFGKISEGTYLSEIFLKFSQRTKRKMTIIDLHKIVQKRIKDFADAIVTVSIPSPTGGSQAPIQLEISGPDLKEMDAFALKVKDRLQLQKGFTSVDSSVRSGKKKIRITPRRDVLSALGLAEVTLGTDLRANLDGLEAATFKKGSRNYDIRVKFKEKYGKEQVKDFSFRGKDGKTIPLSALANINELLVPIQINRKDKRRIVKIESYLYNLPLGKAIEKLNEIIEEIGLPIGCSYRYSGAVEMMEETQTNLGIAGAAAMILVVLTLSAIMESFTQPALILVTVPLALMGVLWTLYVTGNAFSIFVVMGTVMLIGIVVNNAILILERYNVFVQEGKPRDEAIILASKDQFRPIVMITFGAVLGMLPMALSNGIGAEMRKDVGWASAGGIFISGIFSIFVIPIIYMLVIKIWKKKKTE